MKTLHAWPGIALNLRQLRNTLIEQSTILEHPT